MAPESTPYLDPKIHLWKSLRAFESILLRAGNKGWSFAPKGLKNDIVYQNVRPLLAKQWRTKGCSLSENGLIILLPLVTSVCVRNSPRALCKSSLKYLGESAGVTFLGLLVSSPFDLLLTTQFNKGRSVYCILSVFRHCTKAVIRHRRKFPKNPLWPSVTYLELSTFDVALISFLSTPLTPCYPEFTIY